MAEVVKRGQKWRKLSVVVTNGKIALEDNNMLVGSSDFISLHRDGLYVDKTDILNELSPLVQSSTSIIVNRPRRFGKSLMISMLEVFYSFDYESDSYFEGLKIASSPHYSLMNQFPVIVLSFKDISSVPLPDVAKEIRRVLADIFRKWQDRVLPCCDEEEAKYVRLIASMKAEDSDYLRSLVTLSRLIYRQFNKKPLIFIDEYDAPLEAAYGSDYYEGILLLLKGLYLATFKDTDVFGFGYISGVFGIAKGTLGTGLNNIPVDSGQTSPLSKNYFGFDEEEIEDLCRRFRIDPQAKDKLKKYYGGYEFLGVSYYNPWSVFNFIANRAFFSYWGNSGSNKAFSKVVEKAHIFDDQFLATMVHGGMDVNLDFTASYEDVGSDLASILLYLALAGYLSMHPIGFNQFHVFLPNEETKQCFVNEVVGRYRDQNGLRKVTLLRQAIETGNGESVAEFFKTFLLSSLSYYDFSDEKNYQIMVGTVAAMLFDECLIKYEVIAGTGRCDIQISPLNEGGFGAAKVALSQVKKKDYLQELCLRHANPLYAYGFAFHKNVICVESEKIEGAK